jgi:DNA-directed RNA polymerase I, II, and III subunit RPABC2
MDDENDNDFDIENSNEVDFSDNEDAIDQFIIDDEKKDDQTGFKIVTSNNILEHIEKNPKKTVPVLSKFEKARIVGVRLQQLAYGAKPRIDTTGLKSIKEIVEQELSQRKLPFILKRTLPNGSSEYWKMEEFEIV